MIAILDYPRARGFGAVNIDISVCYLLIYSNKLAYLQQIPVSVEQFWFTEAVIPSQEHAYLNF